jgi:Membrane bound FAD containing D-sorbitol dehydrogenase
MEDMMTPLDRIARKQPPTPTQMQRRIFMGGSVTVVCTWMLGMPLLSKAIAAGTEIVASAPAMDAFLQVSLILTGHGQLPSAQAARMYRALAASDPDFSTQVQALQMFMTERKLAASGLQGVLDSEKPAFAALPRRILQCWYVGVAGSGAHAACVAYEDALMNVAVSDQLRPPSYAYGAYGSWSAQPVQKSEG